MYTICICGGGSLGHVIAGWLSARDHAKVNILTNRPEKWNYEIEVDTPEGSVLRGKISMISKYPKEVVPMADVVLLCLPGFLINGELEKLKPYLSPNAFVGSVFSSTGFFFEAQKILSDNQPLWGFQRVPFISRVEKYGKSAHLLGYKNMHNIAVENVSDTEKVSFASLMQEWFERPVSLLKNYLEASLTNSNPLLHTSRLYTMFGDKNEGKIYSRMQLFYEEWTEEAASLYIKMDEEFFHLLKVLPVMPYDKRIPFHMGNSHPHQPPAHIFRPSLPESSAPHPGTGIPDRLLHPLPAHSSTDPPSLLHSMSFQT